MKSEEAHLYSLEEKWGGARRGLILEIRKFLTQQVYRLQEVHHKQHLKLQWCASGKFAKIVR